MAPTPKQKKFADTYIDTGNGTRAALEAYDTDKEEVAAVIASENLRKPKVLEYLESRSEQAAIRVVELSEQDENLNVALGASKDILDRAGYKPVEKSQSVVLNLAGEIGMTEKEKKIKEEFEERLKKSIQE